ncbi:MAG: DAK2 domain-containing protein [Nitriliruptoraceae bacterium]
MSPTTPALEAGQVPALLARIHAALQSHRAEIDALNVFPVPDGDTGTNMTLTLAAGLQASEATAPDRSGARDVVRATIRAARGNSGVVLSQVVRALVEPLDDDVALDGAGYAAALTAARDLAYDALAQPVEGTILSAITAAAAEAQHGADDGDDLVEVARRVCVATRRAVEHTPHQLDVLREAGVVDAGARGFEVVVTAIHDHLRGTRPPTDGFGADAHGLSPPHEASPSHAHGHAEVGHHRQTTFTHPYEVEFLLDTSVAEVDLDVLRHDLEAVGDSVAVVSAEGLLKVHVHTDDIGAALSAGLRHGQPTDVDVVHFETQVDDRSRRRHTGLVVVIDGPGAVALARLHQATVVDTDDGALPTVSALLDAVGRTTCDHTLLLPGTPDAVAAARATVEIARTETRSTVTVVTAADTPPAVLAAVAVFDPTGAPDVMLARIEAAVTGVRGGQVVEAVRDAQTALGPVRTGDALAVLADRTVVCTDHDELVALDALLDALRVDDAELVTVLVGVGPTHTDVEAVRDRIQRTAPHADVEVVLAGQHHARWWIGVE